MTLHEKTDEQREIIDSIERWAERELRPVARKFDHADEYPAEIVEQMKDLGLFGATIAPEYGGLGLIESVKLLRLFALFR